MKSAADVLARLGTLAEADRGWILAQLPAGSKARLLEVPEATAAFAPPPPAAVTAPGSDEQDETSPRSMLVKADPRRVIRALEAEPAWLIASLLQLGAWPWRATLLANLSNPVRCDVRRFAAATFTPHLLDAVLRLVSQKVADGDVPRPGSRFSRLVAKLSAPRVRKRLSLHL
jgi:hypothetical protein